MAKPQTTGNWPEFRIENRPKPYFEKSLPKPQNHFNPKQQAARTDKTKEKTHLSHRKRMTEAVVQRSENLRFEPVATVGGSRTLRSGFWVGQVRDFTTSRTEPVSGAGVAGGDGDVENSVRVNSDERGK
ncbi:unnamed protein product [Prunus armeniaca]